VCFSISLELNSEWRVSDDGLKLASRTIEYSSCTGSSVLGSGSTRAEFGSANNGPFLGLVITLFPGFGAMTELDITLLTLLFVNSNSGGTRFEERNGERQANGLVGIGDSLENGS
jgi:hypothetical protein